MAYKFIKTADPDNEFDITNVTIEFDAVSLDTMLEVFEEFLAACGYKAGSLEFKDKDE